VKEWTIDTWVLYKVNEGDLDAHTFLIFILKHRHRIVFDQEGHIANEYKRCFQQHNNKFLFKWFEALKRHNAIMFYSGKLSQEHKQALLRMKFDPSDLVFVAVASRSKDKLLVSEDSDYTPAVCNYLKQNLQVQVLKLTEATELAT